MQWYYHRLLSLWFRAFVFNSPWQIFLQWTCMVVPWTNVTFCFESAIWPCRWVPCAGKLSEQLIPIYPLYAPYDLIDLWDIFSQSSFLQDSGDGTEEKRKMKWSVISMQSGCKLLSFQLKSLLHHFQLAIALLSVLRILHYALLNTGNELQTIEVSKCS